MEEKECSVQVHMYTWNSRVKFEVSTLVVVRYMCVLRQTLSVEPEACQLDQAVGPVSRREPPVYVPDTGLQSIY